MTIRDIAKLANVSVATVSKIINKKDESISAPTRERVLQIIKEYNYTPFANVRVPVKGTTLLIGILTSGRGAQAKKLNGILRAIHREGYNAIVCTCSSKEETQKKLQVLFSYNVDGILWIQDEDETRVSEQIGEIAHLILRDNPAIDSNCVGFSDADLAAQGAKELIARKHSRVLCAVPDRSARSRHFCEGFRQQMSLAGVPCDAQMCQVFGEEELSLLLSRYTAILCMGTEIARRVAESAKNLHLHIPNDLSLLCVDVDGRSDAQSEHISTLRPLCEQLGDYAATLLIHRLENNPVPLKVPALIAPLENSESIDMPKMLRNKQILVVGSVNMDVFIGLDQPLQAGELVSARSCVKVPGGKGLNQAVGVAKLGMPAALIGCLGKDYEGGILYDYLKNNRVNVDSIQFSSKMNTGNAYVHVWKDGETTIVTYSGASDLICAQNIRDNEALFNHASYCLAQFIEQEDLIPEVVRAAQERGCKVILKPCKAEKIDDGILKGVDILLPNKKEISRLLPGEGSYEEKAQYFLDRGVQHVIITLGHSGCYLRDANHSRYFPAADVTPVDTTGAGDAFAATLSVYLSEGADIERAIEYATIAAGLSTTRQGVPTSLVDRETIELYMSRQCP